MTALWRRLPAVLAALVLGLAGSAVAARVVPHSCTRLDKALEVNVSTEKAGGEANPKAVDRLAGVYNGLGRQVRVGDEYYCPRVHVTSLSSGLAATALAGNWRDSAYTAGEPQPEVWLPSSSVWPAMLRLSLPYAVLAPDEIRSLATSPLVLGLPRNKAGALRGLLGYERFDWKQMLRLVDDRNIPISWGQGELASGEAGWGRFHLGKDDPMFSTSGLAAVVTEYQDLHDTYPADEAIQREFRKLESLVSTDGYTPDGTQMMRNLANLDQRDTGWGADTSAVVIQESLLYQYDMKLLGGDAPADEPQQLLLPFYAQQSLVMDHPYVELSALRNSAVRKAVADDFRAFLLTDDAREEFGRAGLRDPAGNTLSGLNALNDKLQAADTTQGRPVPAMVAARNWPEPSVIRRIQGIWQNTRKRANVLILMDESGSMNKKDTGQTADRKTLAKQALLDAAGRWTTANDRITLWGFSAPKGDSGAAVTRELMPWKPGGRSAELTKAAGKLGIRADTPLFRAIRDARAAVTEQAKTATDGEYANVVVVLTDGADDFQGDPASVAWSEGENVPVYAIGFGPEAPEAAASLQKIVGQTGGKYEDASNPTAIDKAFASMLRVA